MTDTRDRVSDEADPNPFAWFDAIRMINLDSRADRRATMERRFARLGIAGLVERLPAIATPQNHHVGCALSHRAVLEDAHRRGLRNVLVFEDDVVFDRQTLPVMATLVEEIGKREWDLLYLGGHVWGETFDLLAGSDTLRVAKGITCTQAIAYNATSFEPLLRSIPDTREAVARWLETENGIDQYFARLDVRKLLSNPMLATQIELFDQPGMNDRSHFDI